ncbi:MAG: protein kinase [Deltaproteobacteria bacterium]|nr:protein kinase [Deltaproteobacteria bacterium]
MGLPALPFLIDQKYKAVKLLGKGGVGYAVLAEKEGREFAVKLLNLALVKDPQKVIQKFKKEFLTLKKLNHPHIGKIYDFGFDPDLNFYYFAGEYIRGEEIRKATVQSPVEAIEALFVQALQAMHYLHAFGRAGLRHNDIKAANILVTREANQLPAVKLIDFGLSGLAPLAMRGGTASYMSPEQIVLTFPEFAKGKTYPKPDGRADLYALGVVWYFCLTGLNPFLVGGDPEASLKRHFEFSPQPPSSLRKEIPGYLDKIILKLIKLNPDERYASAAEVIQDLRYLSGKPYSVIPRAARSCFLPEGEWINQDQAWRPLKAKWPPAAPEHVWIIASPGQGKTKILEQFKNHVQSEGGKVLLLKQTAQEALEEWLADLKGASENLSRPTVVAVDDFGEKHPARPRLEELWEHIRYSRHWDPQTDIPWLFVFTGSAEPVFHPEFPGATLRLRNFNPADLKEFLRRLAPKKDAAPPEKFLRKLYRHTDGNPQWVTLVLKAMGEKGLLWNDDGDWAPDLFQETGVDFGRLPVPGNLTDAFNKEWQARTPEEKEFLKWLACFPGGAPASLPDNPAAGEQLIRLGLLECDDKGRVRFKNGFLQKNIYARLSAGEKQTTHRRIAQTLKKEKAPLHQTAYHLSRCGSPRERLKPLEILARFYQSSGMLEEALAMKQEELRLLPPQRPQKRMETALCVARLLTGLRRFDTAKRTVNRWMKDIPPASRHGIWRARFLKVKSEIFCKEDRFQAARRCLEQALKIIAAQRGPVAEKLILKNGIANTFLSEGKLDAAIALYQQTRRTAAALEFQKAKEVTNNDLAHCYLLNHEEDLAEQTLVEDMTFFQKIADRRKLIRCHYFLGELMRRVKRNFNEAIKHYQQCEKLARGLKDIDILMRAYNGLASTYLDRAQQDDQPQAYRQALRYYEQGLMLVSKLNKNLHYLDAEAAAFYLGMGMTLQEQGHFQKAHDIYQTIIQVLEPKTKKIRLERARLCEAYLTMGDAFIIRKECGQAKPYLEKAQTIAKGAKDLKEHLFSGHILWARLFREIEEWREAKRHYEEAQEIKTKFKINPTPLAQKYINELKEALHD